MFSDMMIVILLIFIIVVALMIAVDKRILGGFESLVIPGRSYEVEDGTGLTLEVYDSKDPKVTEFGSDKEKVMKMTMWLQSFKIPKKAIDFILQKHNFESFRTNEMTYIDSILDYNSISTDLLKEDIKIAIESNIRYLIQPIYLKPDIKKRDGHVVSLIFDLYKREMLYLDSLHPSKKYEIYKIVPKFLENVKNGLFNPYVEKVKTLADLYETENDVFQGVFKENFGLCTIWNIYLTALFVLNDRGKYEKIIRIYDRNPIWVRRRMAEFAYTLYQGFKEDIDNTEIPRDIMPYEYSDILSGFVSRLPTDEECNENDMVYSMLLKKCFNTAMEKSEHELAHKRNLCKQMDGIWVKPSPEIESRLENILEEMGYYGSGFDVGRCAAVPSDVDKVQKEVDRRANAAINFLENKNEDYETSLSDYNSYWVPPSYKNITKFEEKIFGTIYYASQGTPEDKILSDLEKLQASANELYKTFQL